MIDVFILILILANAFLVLMEFALMRARPARIEIFARQGNPRALAVQDILGHFDDYLAAMQLCITMISLALGAIGEPEVMEEIQILFSSWSQKIPYVWLHAFSFALAVSVLAVFQIILAELIPRAVAVHYAEAIALIGARPLKWVASFLRLPVRFMTGVAKILLRTFGLKPISEADHTVSMDEMRVLLGQTQDKGAMPLERLFLLENLFDFASAKAAEAMRPREKIIFLSLAKSWQENLQIIRQKRFTRYPLCSNDTIDSVVGYVNIKDIVLSENQKDVDLSVIKRDLFEVLETDSLEKLVKTMPDKGIHMALVRDGTWKISGLITLEDIVEELVGEVRDEFGRPRGWADGELFARAVVEANLPVGDLRQIISALVSKIKSAHPTLNDKAALEAIWEREQKFSSAVGRGALVPHARLPGLSEPLIAVGRFSKPFTCPTPDSTPIHLVFLILTPSELPLAQLKILQRIAGLVSNENLRRKLWGAKSSEALLEILRTADTVLAI